MKAELMPGKYVVAVSGGVDSMVLLHLLAERMAEDAEFEPGSFTVAHFDHGIRADSAEDRELVQATAEALGMPFICAEGRLGARASEALARDKRYEFLRAVQQQAGAQAIITAHHQDDLLETVLLNMLRGTGRRGLSSLRSQADTLRPLLHLPKAEIVAYAQAKQVPWREDSTNADVRYRRNYIRHRIMPRLGSAQRQQLQAHADKALLLNDKIEQLLGRLLDAQPDTQTIDRHFFIQLPHAVSREVLAVWLRRHNLAFDRRSIERLVVFAKTAMPGKQADIDARTLLLASKKHITLRSRSGEQ